MLYGFRSLGIRLLGISRTPYHHNRSRPHALYVFLCLTESLSWFFQSKVLLVKLTCEGKSLLLDLHQMKPDSLCILRPLALQLDQHVVPLVLDEAALDFLQLLHADRLGGVDELYRARQVFKTEKSCSSKEVRPRLAKSRNIRIYMTFLFLTAVSTLFVCFDNKLVIDGKSEVAVKASLKTRYWLVVSPKFKITGFPT